MLIVTSKKKSNMFDYCSTWMIALSRRDMMLVENQLFHAKSRQGRNVTLHKKDFVPDGTS